ncbi:N-acetylneuraminate synthase family protein [Lentibacter algarum]|uniref:N-acetylneuraminate synthase family protein n=1 Tax=Lentibacter algarum TaxID=576131 RepID=UPI002303F519|nr:N-acetylneuraminate synthase family protein [Lentibacter algarum]
MNTFNIAGRRIGEDQPPLVIAEIGINHGGDINVAKQIVLAAHKAGCEIVKHQTHFIEDEMTDEAKSIIPPNADVSIWDIMDQCSLSKDEEINLKKYTEALGMIYLSTPFSRKAADFLDSIDVPAFKIGSGEADNIPLIRHIAKFGRPVIMSTGMQSIETIRRSVSVLEEANTPYALLECTNLYPSPPENVSLQGISDLRSAFPNAVIGFSDHSIGPTMALSSVALGASIIERHFTDSRYRIGPDISCSMDPAELKFIIDQSKEVHCALMNPKKRSDAEESVYKFARSSIVADRDLYAGHVITEADIWARRPGNGEIAGHEFDEIVGRTLSKAVVRNQQLCWGDLEGQTN